VRERERERVCSSSKTSCMAWTGVFFLPRESSGPLDGSDKERRDMSLGRERRFGGSGVLGDFLGFIRVGGGK